MIFFKRTYIIPAFDFKIDELDAALFTARNGRLVIELQTEGAAASGGEQTVAEVLVVNKEPRKSLASLFNAIRHNRPPDTPEEMQSAFFARALGIPWTQQTSIMRDCMPEEFQSYARDMDRELDSSIFDFVGLMRWRLGRQGPAMPFAEKYRLYWSTDREAWHLMPLVANSKISTDIVSLIRPEFNKEVIALIDSGTHEPLYQEMFRESVALLETSPRSALSLAVAAAEISIKITIADLLPTSNILSDKKAPPAEVSFRETLPTLPVRNRINGASSTSLSISRA